MSSAACLLLCRSSCGPHRCSSFNRSAGAAAVLDHEVKQQHSAKPTQQQVPKQGALGTVLHTARGSRLVDCSSLCLPNIVSKGRYCRVSQSSATCSSNCLLVGLCSIAGISSGGVAVLALLAQPQPQQLRYKCTRPANAAVSSTCSDSICWSPTTDSSLICSTSSGWSAVSAACQTSNAAAAANLRSRCGTGHTPYPCACTHTSPAYTDSSSQASRCQSSQCADGHDQWEQRGPSASISPDDAACQAIAASHRGKVALSRGSTRFAAAATAA